MKWNDTLIFCKILCACMCISVCAWMYVFMFACICVCCFFPSCSCQVYFSLPHECWVLLRISLLFFFLSQKHLFSGLIRAGAKLKELDLSHNALGPVGVEGMVDFMSSPVCYSLEVSLIEAESKWTYIPESFLLWFRHETSQLPFLVVRGLFSSADWALFSYNLLFESFMCNQKALCNVCHALPFQELRLDNNGLGIKGGTMLAQSLMKLVNNAKDAGTPLKLKVRLTPLLKIFILTVVIWDYSVLLL